MSGNFRGGSGRGGDMPYRGGRPGGGDAPRQGGGRGGYQGGGGGRSGGPPSGPSKMLEGSAEITKTVHQFEDSWITAGGPVRPEQGTLAARPVYGTKGRQITVRANYFSMDLNPKVKIHSYIAKISPEPKPKRHLLELWDKILAHPNIVRIGAASDKATELITLGNLGNVPTLTFKLKDKDKHKEYSVKLELNTVIDHNKIIAKLKDTTLRTPDEGEAVMVRALNILMAAHPGKDGGITTLGKGSNNKFFWIDGRQQSSNLFGGLECIRGYYASVRLTASGVQLNLSVNHSAFYRPGPLVDLWNAFCAETQDVRPDQQLLLFSRYVRMLRVECTHLSDETEKGKIPRIKTIWALADKEDGRKEKHPPRVKDFGADAHSVEFHDGNSYIAVANYFKNVHNVTLKHGDKPVVNVGNKERPEYLPMDVLKIPRGRVFRGELLLKQRQNIITFSCRKPPENYDSITTHGLEITGVKNDHTMKLGIKVSSEMGVVPARILNAPNLKYGNGKETPRGGSWNLRGRKFTIGCKVRTWAAVVITNEKQKGYPRSDPMPEFRRFERKMRELGMDVQGLIPTVLTIKLDKLQPKERLLQINEMFSKLKQKNVELAVILIPASEDRVFDHLKWRGDTMDGIMTHCCAMTKFWPTDRDAENAQYHANNAMKVNLRFGGVNQTLEMPASSPLIAAGKTMVVGLDVTHPSPTDPDTFPSIASIVASTNALMGQWPGQVRIQERRRENVQFLEEMLKARLQRWKVDNKGQLPENILIFRDGVSEGQYEMVLRDELGDVQKAFKSVYGDKKQPNVTILVGGKRHNTRFFPTTSKDMDGRSNCFNGTVVDRGITRPIYWDFYLQAQAPLQGSARSAHYVVIHDEIFRNPSLKREVGPNASDAIQELTHNICYMMGRCTRSISYSTPAFLADRFADRARKYVRAYYWEHQVVRGKFFPPPPSKDVTNLARNLAETMVYI